MRLVIRLVGALVLSILLVSVFFSYYQVQRDKRNLRTELQRRADVLAESLGQNAETLLQLRSTAELQRRLQRFADKNQLVGVAVYGEQNTALAITALLAARLPQRPALVKQAMESGQDQAQFLSIGGSPVHFYATPLRVDQKVVGGLLVVHDASYISLSTAREWRAMSLRVLAQICLITLTTLLVFRRSVMRPIARTAAWMRELRAGRTPPAVGLPDSDMFASLAGEARNMAHSLTAARASAEQEARLREAGESSWTAQRLAASLPTKLKGSRLFVVSNREPYMHIRQGKLVQIIVPASGLVTGLEPVLCACNGTWVAHGSGDADKAVVDERNCLRVPPDDPRYTLRRVWLSKQQEEGYYYGFANEGLWPLCHIAHTRPIFRATDWEHYRQVNATFAEALLEEMAGVEHPVAIIQDYHFALLPKLIKQRRPDARVGIFWHIPWPNPEAFGICPWQQELLEGLLGGDLVAFHIQAHCDNFLETVNVALESRIEWDRFLINRGSRVTLVRPFPISVAFNEAAGEGRPTHEDRASLLNELGTDALYLGIGVDRVDYTKGILERFLAVERFLEKYPQYIGKFTFVQIGAPSRTRIKRYHDFHLEVAAEAERVNARFCNGNWLPILFLKRHHSHQEVERYYRTADVCLVTSLHDGMNLVAKEFVAARDDEEGMLVLSQFTGAARELTDALIVNPYNTEQLADAIFVALEMDIRERKRRMRRMRDSVKEANIYRWASSLIGELCEVPMPPRKSERAANSPPSSVAEARAAGE